MLQIVEKLVDLPLLSGLSRDRIRDAAGLWQGRELAAETPLWWHGDVADELAVVLSGGLKIEISGRELGRVGAGEIVGEAAAWTGGLRTASVHAAKPTTLAILSTESIPTLRARHPEVYDRLLKHALLGLARRIRLVDRQIAGLAIGVGSAPGRQSQSALGRLWQRLTTSAPSPPPARQALRAMPALKATHAATLSTIESALTPRHLPAGTPIFLEGDPGDSVFVVADGCIDIIRHVRGGRGERLASLYPGALFGTGSLLLGERRNASCVAAETTACWVFEMDQAAFGALSGEPGRVWQESILEALRFQLSRADEQLTRLKSPGSTDYERIRAGLV
ncbi:MAG: CRP-like cAMP-binding protein [Myxococcota bacterium]